MNEAAESIPSQWPNVWVPATLRTLCDLLIFVDQAAEAVASHSPVKFRRGVLGERSEGSSLALSGSATRP
jgi:hypothetical protein